MQEIQKVDIFSLAKIAAAMGAAYGFIMGILVAIGTTFGLAPVVGVAAIAVLPIIYGVLGFIGGAVAAFVYNWLAEQIGGIKIQLG